jgi:hypothetical protein
MDDDEEDETKYVCVYVTTHMLTASSSRKTVS